MSDFLLQLKKEHEQQLDSLKKQHTQLAEQIRNTQSQMAAVEGAFTAKEQSLKQIETALKASEAAQLAQNQLAEKPLPPAGEGEVPVPPAYKKPVKSKKNAPRPAVVSTEAALPH